MSTRLIPSFEEGLDYVAKEYERLRATRKGLVIVGVVGGSASGKTRFATQLQGRYSPDACVLSLDHYCRGRQYKREHGIESFDDPRYLDLDLFYKHLTELRQRRPIERPIYSFQTGERSLHTERVEPKQLTIIEGLFLFGQDSILKQCDIAIFVEASEHAMFWRRILRDIERTGQTAEEIACMFIEEVSPAYTEHVLPKKELVQVVIENDLVPESEMIALAELQIQRKAQVGVLPDVEFEVIHQQLTYLGLPELDLFSHLDAFFVYPSRPRTGGELVRLRNESSRVGGMRGVTTLTYKGPFVGSGRGVYRFPVDKDLRRLLGQIGYVEDFELGKQRHLFSSTDGSIEIALDNVFAQDGNERSRVFIEVRASTDKLLAKTIDELCQVIPNLQFTQESYWDILSP